MEPTTAWTIKKVLPNGLPGEARNTVTLVSPLTATKPKEERARQDSNL